MQTMHPPAGQRPSTGNDSRLQTLASFDWQWGHVPRGDFMPGDPWFDAHAADICARELCGIDPAWFAGRRVLDAGCGQGRWTRSLLELGAEVTAIDFSEAGLRRTVELCGASPRLTTMRVDLLDSPPELLAQKFDLVFSFGVLHHTGDTWKALDNVAGLVEAGGALFLYLYGAGSWPPGYERELEELRHMLAPLSFDEKLAELRRRYPGDDPHQMFDLMSPTINDRVRFDDVARALAERGFAQVDRTVESSEVYLRALRPEFPYAAALPPVGRSGRLAVETSRRSIVRRGLGFEQMLREALADVPRRPSCRQADAIVSRYGPEASVVDISLPPDRLDAAVTDASAVDVVLLDGTPPPLMGDVVLHLGAALGACRFPRELMAAMWRLVRPGGTLVVELVPDALETRRHMVDRLRDRHLPVPAKVGALLRRHPEWTTGEALHAVGGHALLNPLPVDEAATLLQERGALRVERVPGRRGGELLVSVRRA